MVFPLYLQNDLWYHTDLKVDRTANHLISPELRVNRLSDAAQFELWHQRLAHCGSGVLEEIHKHVDGVPKLRGNAFYKCPSCMSGKLCTKNPRHSPNLGLTMNKQPSSDPSKNLSNNWEGISFDESNDDWEDYMDELHLPQAQQGMHFHASFGFVRGSTFRLKTESGKTITSIDGKNSYCLIVDRATR